VSQSDSDSIISKRKSREPILLFLLVTSLYYGGNMFLLRMKKYDISLVFCNLSEDVMRQHVDCESGMRPVVSCYLFGAWRWIVRYFL
jgi:hypothetical protein